MLLPLPASPNAPVVIQTPLIPDNVMFESQYRALRNMAFYCLRGERQAQSFTPTVLVHEAYLSLARSTRAGSADQAQFLRLVGRVMRNLLIDRARCRKAIVHGGELQRVEWNDLLFGSDNHLDQVLDVACVMERLAAKSPRLARLVELRYFIGFSEEETAQIMRVSVRTVRRQWKVARLRLFELMPVKSSHEIH